MSLKQVYEGMKQQAKKGQTAQRHLSRGLILTLRREVEDGRITWHLSLTRRGERPEPKEQAIVRNIFGVPKGTKGKYEERGGYHIIRLAWTDGPEDEAEPEQGRLL